MTHPFRAVALLVLAALPSLRAASSDVIHKSLVRIQTVSQDPDYRAPWNPGTIGEGIGAGFVIDGDRILTNAHVVSNGRKIWITRDGDPKRYVSTVKFIAHDTDLAIVQPLNMDFFKGMQPLEFNGIPKL